MVPTMWGQVCNVTTAGVETRTLDQPTRAGIQFTVNLSVDVGTMTLTVTGGYNNDDDTAIIFDDAGDKVTFMSNQEGTSYFWRAMSQNGTDAAVETGEFDTLIVSGTSAVTGVSTPTGGTAPAGGTTIVLARPGCVHTGGVPATATAEGIDATPIITEIYYSEIFVPCNMSVTGISWFNGSVATNDSRHSALLDADGALVTGSATGADATSGTDVYQKQAFTGGAITVLGPATYYVATIFGGTTDRYNAHGTATTGLGFATNLVAGKITAQTYAAIPATNTLTLTYTTDLGPIASLY